MAKQTKRVEWSDALKTFSLGLLSQKRIIIEISSREFITSCDGGADYWVNTVSKDFRTTIPSIIPSYYWCQYFWCEGSYFQLGVRHFSVSVKCDISQFGDAAIEVGYTVSKFCRRLSHNRLIYYYNMQGSKSLFIESVSLSQVESSHCIIESSLLRHRIESTRW